MVWADSLYLLVTFRQVLFEVYQNDSETNLTLKTDEASAATSQISHKVLQKFVDLIVT